MLLVVIAVMLLVVIAVMLLVVLIMVLIIVIAVVLAVVCGEAPTHQSTPTRAAKSAVQPCACVRAWHARATSGACGWCIRYARAQAASRVPSERPTTCTRPLSLNEAPPTHPPLRRARAPHSGGGSGAHIGSARSRRV